MRCTAIGVLLAVTATRGAAAAWFVGPDGKPGNTGSQGRFTFRGFFGQYNVVQEHEGRTTTATIHVSKGGANHFEAKPLK